MKTNVQIDGREVLVTPTGVKIGSKGRVTRDATSVFQMLSKSDARRVRKALFARGLRSLASAKRF